MIMYLLKVTLILKIVLTICWSAALLFLSKSQFEYLGMPEPKPLLFTRLLGAAFIALLVGYALGLRDLHRGKTPVNTMLVGIVSNGLACVLLVYFGIHNTWSEWAAVARYSMWGSAISTGSITALLSIAFYPWAISRRLRD
jgi:Na+-driven multidrug efflux pump